MAEDASDESGTRAKAYLTRYGGLGAIACICLLLAVQLASAREVERRTAELHACMNDTQTLALQLTRRLGYGGLIHNFKNLVLRSDDSPYYQAAVKDAEQAIRLIDELEARAILLGTPLVLDSTRDMIEAYRARLDEVRTRHRQGEAIATIDHAVRFDDRYAVREVDTLLETLSRAVTLQVRQIEREAELLSGLRTGGGVLLGTLVLALWLNQRQRRRHVNAVRQMNRRLEHGNAELTAANTALQQFAGMASHDLKGPLRNVSFFSECVTEDSEEPELVREHAAAITTVVQRMERLVESLLDFTRTGFAQPKLVRVDVTELVDGVLKELRPAIDSTGATLRLQLEGAVMADPELLRRVLHNLLNNSLMYVHPERSPQIDVVARTLEEKIEFSISDNGIGIEPRFAERIFEPCQRLHGPQSQYLGSGIGLSLVRAVIESHAGTLRLDIDYDQGARFVFCLDAAEAVTLKNAA